MRQFRNYAAFFAAIAVLPATAACAQQGSSPSNFAGAWAGTLMLDGLSHPFTLLLVSKDSIVSGVFSDDCWTVRDHVCVEAGSRDIDHPRVTGDTLTFAVDRLEFSAVRRGSTLRMSLVNPYDGSKHTIVAIKQP